VKEKKLEISSIVQDIVSNVFDGLLLTRDGIIRLLEMRRNSMDAGLIMTAANAMNRTASRGKAEVHAQIGLNLSRQADFDLLRGPSAIYRENKNIQ
jgi:hypothetical protein